jgi:hypothetical protein
MSGIAANRPFRTPAWSYRKRAIEAPHVTLQQARRIGKALLIDCEAGNDLLDHTIGRCVAALKRLEDEGDVDDQAMVGVIHFYRPGLRGYNVTGGYSAVSVDEGEGFDDYD